MISTFGLNKRFVNKFAKIPAPFGWKSGPNSVGEIVCARTYSRFLEERGANERWHEICERVVNGCYRMQEIHVRELNIAWDEEQAQRSAQEMFTRMFYMKFLPPGRGLWCMGTDIINKRRIHAALMNCAFVSTQNLDVDKHMPFCFLMDASMLGVGVGFDTKGAGKLKIRGVKGATTTYRIPDSREGWVESVKRLILSYVEGLGPIEFIYSDIRKKGLIIKMFGGLSSGPEPLVELHQSIRNVLEKRKGQYLNTRDIVDIMNLIGVCVVAGNVRRTAEIAFGEPDDVAFAQLKNYKLNPERQKFGWTSNNSINAILGQSYDKYVDAVRSNGEPGFAWLENMRNFGRISDPPNYRDHRVMGGNPCLEQSLESYELCCVSGDTRIQTRINNPKIEDVVGKVVEIWNGKNWSKVKPFLAKTNTDLYEVCLSDGSSLTVTSNHQWSIKSGRSWKQVYTTELTVGSKLPEFELGAIEGKQEVHAYEYGLFSGDGYLDGDRPLVSLHGQKAFDVVSSGTYYKEQELPNAGLKVTRISLKGILDLETCKVLRREDRLPDCVWSWDKDSILSFLAGYIDTDGSSQCSGFRVFGKQGKLLELQQLLRRAGINHASVYLLKGQKQELIINGAKVKRNYPIYTLQIASFECGNVPTRIKRLKHVACSRFVKNNAHIQSAPIDRAKKQKVVSITYKGKGNSYCFTEPETHMGVFGNVITYQCLVETFINRHDNIEDYKRTLKYAYLYGKTVTLGKTHWLDSNRVMLRNRRIGCSISGVQQFVQKNGMAPLRSWLHAGYGHIQKLDEKYSEWLCIPRSIKTTSIKPSGTVSLLTGSTPGMHWPICNYHIRRITLAKNSSMAAILADAGYKVEQAKYDKSSVIVEMPVEPEVVVRDVSQVSMWEQLEMAALLQAEWADNQVSCTVTFDPETEGKDIARALDVYQYRLKGVSFLPQKKIPLDCDANVKRVRDEEPYSQMPYSPITKSEYDIWTADLKRIDYTKLVSREGGSDRFCDGDKCLIVPEIVK